MRLAVKQISKCEKGVAFIEFAICIPFLLIVFFGTVEVSRYFLAIQKVEKTLDLTVDTVAQADQNSSTYRLTTAGMNSLFSTVAAMMSPYEFGSKGVVIITSITMNNVSGVPTPQINWQACGGGTLAKTSQFGVGVASKANPTTAVLPAGLTLQVGDELLVGEIYYNYVPITIQDMVGSSEIARTIYFVPRIGSLASFNSICN